MDQQTNRIKKSGKERKRSQQSNSFAPLHSINRTIQHSRRGGKETKDASPPRVVSLFTLEVKKKWGQTSKFQKSFFDDCHMA